MLFLSATRQEISQENEGWLVIQSRWQPGIISICFQVSIREKKWINSSFVVVTLRKTQSIQLSPGMIPVGNAEEGKSSVSHWVKAAIRLDRLYLYHNGEIHLFQQLSLLGKRIRQICINRKKKDIYKKETGMLFQRHFLVLFVENLLKSWQQSINQMLWQI